jgi:hypothetical protein
MNDMEIFFDESDLANNFLIDHNLDIFFKLMTKTKKILFLVFHLSQRALV